MTFNEQLMDILEVDEIHDSDILAEFEEFDSLAIISIIALIGKTCGKTVSASNIRSAKTIGDIKKLCE